MQASTISPRVERPDSVRERSAGRCAHREGLNLSLLLVVGLFVRLALLWRFDGMDLRVSDERDYDELAINLVRHHEYAFEQGIPTSLRPPLYPALVAGIYQIAGLQNYQAVRLVQVFLGLLIVLVVYLLGRNAYGSRVGLIAAAICCFYPSLVGATNLVLTETLFTLLLCLFALLIQQYLSSAQRVWLAAAGLTLGLAALTRSVLWLFPPVAALFLVVYGRERFWLGRVVSAGILVFAFCIVLAPWTIRNTLLQKTFTTVDVMGGRNVMMGNYEYTLVDRPWATIAVTGENSWHNVLARKYSLRGKTQGQIDKLAMRYAGEYVRANPLQTLGRSTAKFFDFWQLERELVAGVQQGLWGQFSKPFTLCLAAVIVGVYVFTMTAGIFGAWMRPLNGPFHIFVMLLILFVTALHALAFGHSRYHLPLMPLVIVYAAAALDQWRSLAGQWKSWRFAAALACLLVLTASWGLEVMHEMGRFGPKPTAKHIPTSVPRNA
jgi:4-amino-4-deoxy-L-arabinose transferase-like glycosyltransferase